MNFEALRNIVKQATNEEESFFSFTPDMFGFDSSQGLFSELLDNQLIIKPMTINYAESFIQIEGTSNINSINLNILIVLFIENEIAKYHCIVRLPDDWIHNKVSGLENIIKQVEGISGIKYSIHHPGLALSTGGPSFGKMHEIEGLPLNISGFIIFSEIKFTGGIIDTLRGLLNIPNTFKLILPTNTLSTPNATVIQAIYEVSSSQGAITFDGIVINISTSQFELSCNMRIGIGNDTLMFQIGIDLMNQGAFALVFRLIGVQNNDNHWGLGMTRDWINPLGIPRITISELAARYSVESRGFVISLSGTIKIGESQNDEIVLNIKGLELLNGTLPIAFIGSLNHSNGEEITLPKLINIFFKIIEITWQDGLIDNFYPLLKEIEVREWEVYFVIGPNEFISPRDNLIKFQPGIGMYVDASLDTFNVKIHVFQRNEGHFLIRGQMDVLNFGNGIINLTSASNTNRGPTFTFESREGNSLQLDLKVSIFGQPMITVDAFKRKDENIIFTLKDRSFQTNFQELKGISYCKGELIDSNKVSVLFNGLIALKEKISVKVLNFTVCEINIAFNFTFDIEINATVNEFYTRFTADISVLDFPTLQLSYTSNKVYSTLKQLEEEISEIVLNNIKDHMHNIKIDNLLNWFDKNWLYFVNPIGQVLKELGVSAKKAAELLNNLSKYSGEHKGIIDILNQGGFSVAELQQITVFNVPTDWIPGDVNLGGLDPGNSIPREWPKFP